VLDLPYKLHFLGHIHYNVDYTGVCRVSQTCQCNQHSSECVPESGVCRVSQTCQCNQHCSECVPESGVYRVSQTCHSLQCWLHWHVWLTLETPLSGSHSLQCWLHWHVWLTLQTPLSGSHSLECWLHWHVSQRPRYNPPPKTNQILLLNQLVFESSNFIGSWSVQYVTWCYL
jgi:hypothetical protein